MSLRGELSIKQSYRVLNENCWYVDFRLDIQAKLILYKLHNKKRPTGLRERFHGRYFPAGWGAEGETPISWGKLSGKRTVIHLSSGESLSKGHRRWNPGSPRARGNLSGKRTGEFWIFSEAPLFFLGRSHYIFKLDRAFFAKLDCVSKDLGIWSLDC